VGPENKEKPPANSIKHLSAGKLAGATWMILTSASTHISGCSAGKLAGGVAVTGCITLKPGLLAAMPSAHQEGRTGMEAKIAFFPIGDGCAMLRL
jgi:hypothetical protein